LEKSLGCVDEDFSIDLSEDWNLNFSVNVNLVSLSIDLSGGCDLLECDKVLAIEGVEGNI
jgi:hypothetical protein